MADHSAIEWTDVLCTKGSAVKRASMATPPLPPTSRAHAVLRQSNPGCQQVPAHPVGDGVLSSAERCHHVWRLDIEDHLEIGNSPWLDAGAEFTEEGLLLAGGTLLESQQQLDDVTGHWPPTVAVLGALLSRTAPMARSEGRKS